MLWAFRVALEIIAGILVFACRRDHLNVKQALCIGISLLVVFALTFVGKPKKAVSL